MNNTIGWIALTACIYGALMTALLPKPSEDKYYHNLSPFNKKLYCAQLFGGAASFVIGLVVAVVLGPP